MYYTDIQIADYYAVSRFTIWRWVREGKFPSPVKLGSGSSRWLRSDIDAFDAHIIEQNRQQSAT